MNFEKLKCVLKLGSIKINCTIAEVDENSLIKIKHGEANFPSSDFFHRLDVFQKNEIS